MKATAKDIALVLLEVSGELFQFSSKLSETFGWEDIPVDPRSKLDDMALTLAGIPSDTWVEDPTGGQGEGFCRDSWGSEIYDRQSRGESPEEIWDWLVSEGAKWNDD